MPTEEILKYIEDFIRDHGYPPKTIRIERKKYEILYNHKDGNITYDCLLKR